MADLVLSRTCISGRNKRWLFLEALLSHNYMDHHSLWALKSRGQRGKPRSEQILMLGFPYHVHAGEEAEFLKKLDEHGLRFYMEPRKWRNKYDAMMTIVYDKDMDLSLVLQLINTVAIPTILQGYNECL